METHQGSYAPMNASKNSAAHCMGVSRDQAHVGVESTQHLPGLSVHYGCLLPHQNGLNSQRKSSPVLEPQTWLPVSEERYVNKESPYKYLL